MTEQTEYYVLVLRFFHPSFDPKNISDLLKLKPDISWKEGEQAKTPSGRLLDFRRKESFWSYCMHGEGKKFSDKIGDIVRIMSPHKNFIHHLIDDGGRVNLYLQLPGSINIGDSLTPDILAGISELKAGLDIEVFPDFQENEQHGDGKKRAE